ALQVAAAVGEGIGGDVENPHHGAPPRPGEAGRARGPGLRGIVLRGGRAALSHGGDHLRRIRSRTSPRETALLLNSPRTAEVVVVAPGLRMPRIDMHRCSASMTTIAARGSSLRTNASAMSLVSRSCTCGRLA